MSVLCSCLVGICELSVTDAVALVAVGLLHHLVGLLLSKVHDVLDDVGLRDGIEELVTEDWLATELASLCRELLLGLGCEGRVDNGTVDEQEQMVLNLRGL